MTVNRRLAAFAALVCLSSWVGTAQADWAACQRKPTRSCLLEEALRGDGGPLVGKDRLDVLILAGVNPHIEYATAADIDEAVRQTKSVPYSYVSLAVRGLIAENRKQEAVDFVASLPLSSGAYLAFSELARALAKLGDLDTVAALVTRMPLLQPRSGDVLARSRLTASIEGLAEVGKIDDALLLLISALTDFPPRHSDIAGMEIAVAQAYAKRGDTKTARRYFDLAGQAWERARLTGYGYQVDEARISLISLSALRGDTGAVTSALQQLRSENPSPLAKAYNSAAYQQLTFSLLKAKQFPLALELAKSAPIFRDWLLAVVGAENAADGRLDDARAVLALFSEKADPNERVIVVRNMAVAMVKAGKLTAAVEMAAQVNDLTGRRAVLFAIAQALPQ